MAANSYLPAAVAAAHRSAGVVREADNHRPGPREADRVGGHKHSVAAAVLARAEVQVSDSHRQGLQEADKAAVHRHSAAAFGHKPAVPAADKQAAAVP